MRKEYDFAHMKGVRNYENHLFRLTGHYMGMFDSVEFEGSCVNCGTLLRHWQTKSTGCHMDRVQWGEIPAGGTFYDCCPTCDWWNQYRVVKVSEDGAAVELCIVTLDTEATKLLPHRPYKITR